MPIFQPITTIIEIITDTIHTFTHMGMWFYSMRLHCPICLYFNFVEYFKVTVELIKMNLPPKQGRIRDLSETVELYQVYSKSNLFIAINYKPKIP